tara:strand:- start:2141 stop:2365 length:225 start_codon:yes stop_codon:yes gene_type:complete
MIISLNSALDLKIFSPSEPIGILILFLGIVFTGMIFYIIYAVSTNKESLEDIKIRSKKEFLQEEKIKKLFPKKK